MVCLPFSSAMQLTSSTSTLSVTATIPVGNNPWGVAVTPNQAYAYVSNYDGGSGKTISVIDTSTNTVVDTIGIAGMAPQGIAVSPNGDYVYFTEQQSSAVGVISTATNTIVAYIGVRVTVS